MESANNSSTSQEEARSRRLDRLRISRDAESPESRSHLDADKAAHVQRGRSAESTESIIRRIDAQNTARAQRVAAEATEVKKRRLSAQRAARARRLAAESPEAKKRRLSAQQAARARRLAAESPEAKKRRLSAQRAARARRLAAESPEAKKRRLSAHNTKSSEAKKSLLSAQRAARARRLAAESHEAKKLRFSAQNIARARRLAAESTEAKKRRLCAHNTARARRLAAEKKRRLCAHNTARAPFLAADSPESTRSRLNAPNSVQEQATSECASETFIHGGLSIPDRRRIDHDRYLASSLASRFKLGVVDVKLFCEGEYQPDDIRHELPNLFAAENVCVHCKALRWKQERGGFCCSNGQIALPALSSPPNEISNLYMNNEFLKNIRSYNNALSLASLGMGKEIIQPGFSPTVTVMGKLYHLMGSLLPQADTPPKFAQIYFTDTTNETQNRLRANPQLDPHIIALLQACLRNVNPYIRTFKAAIEMQSQSSDVRIVIDATKRPAGEHARCFNLPTGSEVAVIMPGGETSTNNMDVIIHMRSGAMQRINAMHRSYDALHYVLLYPAGEDGYHLDRWKTNKKRVCNCE